MKAYHLMKKQKFDKKKADTSFELSRNIAYVINPFLTKKIWNLKISENLRFFDVFREYRSGTLVKNGLIKCVSFQKDILQLGFNLVPLINGILLFFSERHKTKH